MSISSIEELRAIISRGSERRHTAGTNMNDESSRSHLILSIIIESTNLQTQSYARGKVWQDEVTKLNSILVESSGNTFIYNNEIKRLNVLSASLVCSLGTSCTSLNFRML